ncbi:acetylornithine deacetylase [Elongatibacter sediminis]|uniref:N-acetyl-L-citrulline deacetylase n=1 Tax=Elongatibacter sediminis TaxID=3119006 RepID=A0AAW9RBU3_9GAMM
MSLEHVTERLAALVACDTQNPPRHITADAEIFAVCEAALPDGFDVRSWDHGDGHVSWLAVRGRPSVLFNVHLDTVPVGQGWTRDPLQLDVSDGRAYGRGACDIKGAAAVLLELAAQGAENLALLFTSDEEGAGGCCVERFLASGEGKRFRQVVVAEPTGCRAVLSHRGFLSVKTRFSGNPGHSSEARALSDNANHQMALWAAAALELARGLKTSAEDPGSCMNIGIVEGGTKSNVIAGHAFVHWSARLAPGSSSSEFLRAAKACAPAGAAVEWEVPFVGDPLPAGDADTSAAHEFCEAHAIETAPPVDFWTEAALFSGSGLPVFVLGPGDIRQAHVADEWVALEQLERAMNIYGQVVRNDG